jgi:hypothetical protein
MLLRVNTTKVVVVALAAMLLTSLCLVITPLLFVVGVSSRHSCWKQRGGGVQPTQLLVHEAWWSSPSQAASKLVKLVVELEWPSAWGRSEGDADALTAPLLQIHGSLQWRRVDRLTAHDSLPCADGDRLGCVDAATCLFESKRLFHGTCRGGGLRVLFPLQAWCSCVFLTHVRPAIWESVRRVSAATGTPTRLARLLLDSHPATRGVQVVSSRHKPPLGTTTGFDSGAAAAAAVAVADAQFLLLPPGGGEVGGGLSPTTTQRSPLPPLALLDSSLFFALRQQPFFLAKGPLDARSILPGTVMNPTDVHRTVPMVQLLLLAPAAQQAGSDTDTLAALVLELSRGRAWRGGRLLPLTTGSEEASWYLNAYRKEGLPLHRIAHRLVRSANESASPPPPRPPG